MRQTESRCLPSFVFSTAVPHTGGHNVRALCLPRFSGKPWEQTRRKTAASFASTASTSRRSRGANRAFAIPHASIVSRLMKLKSECEEKIKTAAYRWHFKLSRCKCSITKHKDVSKGNEVLLFYRIYQILRVGTQDKQRIDELAQRERDTRMSGNLICKVKGMILVQ